MEVKVSAKYNGGRRQPLGKKAASVGLRFFNGNLLRFIGLLTRLSKSLNNFRGKYLDFVPRDEDIFIVTYPRSGTTLMQMILYQLMTDGGLDFEHISEPCPYLERAISNRRDLEALPSPRIFKTHLPLKSIMRMMHGHGRCIYIARDGRDVALSYYHFYRNGRGFTGTFSQFFERFMKGNLLYGSWFKHVAEGWAHRNDPRLLFLTYEELTGDLEGGIQSIREFCGLDVPAQRMPSILERCSLGFMKQHVRKFDPLSGMQWERKNREPQFIRKGQAGEGAQHLSEQEVLSFEQECAKHPGTKSWTRQEFFNTRRLNLQSM